MADETYLVSIEEKMKERGFDPDLMFEVMKMNRDMGNVEDNLTVSMDAKSVKKLSEKIAADKSFLISFETFQKDHENELNNWFDRRMRQEELREQQNIMNREKMPR